MPREREETAEEAQMTWRRLPGELPTRGKFVNIAYASHDGNAVNVIGGHCCLYYGTEKPYWMTDVPGSNGAVPLNDERVIAWHDAPTWPPK